MHRKGIKRNWLKQVRGMKKVNTFKSCLLYTSPSPRD